MGASTHAHNRQSRSRLAGLLPSARLADRRTQSRTAAVTIAAVSAAPATIWSQSRTVTGGFGVIPTSSTPNSATRNWPTSPHVVPAVRFGAGPASPPVSAARRRCWSRAMAHEDRGAREQRAAQRRPLPPHRLAALRPLGLHEVVEHQSGG